MNFSYIKNVPEYVPLLHFLFTLIHTYIQLVALEMTS